ncbi:hypothetical protein B0T18DRAFT_312867 [Schizothecium vesticola]|uniref:Integrase zinc-binding domain-containing protein n=1 Tax=Schizothecium vesticola TaxID=314040 RepID=A0AA40FC04_9PEZI|nr:hypothetical protein B0T18DRAFT_312867 [Schizothecium vesticola]
MREILEDTHDGEHHFGANRMLHDLVSVLFDRKSATVKSYVRHCQVCVENQISRQKTPGKLQPIAVIPIPGHTIGIDFVVGLPVVKNSRIWATPEGGFDTLMSVSGQFDKRTIAIPGRTT